MVNHARTLLMNVSGAAGFASHLPGDELIPSAFIPLILPNYLQVIRARLFGAMPDRAFLNFRVFQFLQLIESTDLKYRILDFDPRITYNLNENNVFNELTTYVPVVRGHDVSSSDLVVTGKPANPDLAGRSYFEYQVTVIGVGTVRVEQFTAINGISSTETAFDVDSGLSTSIPLPGCGYSVRLKDFTVGNTWTVSGFLKPVQTLPEIHSLLSSMGEPFQLELFGTSSEEPYLTCYNCWKTHPDFAYQMSGFLIAMIHRAEELRRGD